MAQTSEATRLCQQIGHLRHREARLTAMRVYYATHKKHMREQQNEYRRKRLATDPAFRMLHNLRGRVGLALKLNGKPLWAADNLKKGVRYE